MNHTDSCDGARYKQPAFSLQLVAIFRPEPVIIQTLSLIREGLISAKPPSRRVDNACLKLYRRTRSILTRPFQYANCEDIVIIRLNPDIFFPISLFPTLTLSKKSIFARSVPPISLPSPYFLVRNIFRLVFFLN